MGGPIDSKKGTASNNCLIELKYVPTGQPYHNRIPHRSGRVTFALLTGHAKDRDE
jgi:hypothetical protein